MCSGGRGGHHGSVLRGPTTGRLLLATPPLVDPNFDRSVVYMIEHNDDGALGLVLNRPTDDDEVPGLRSWLTICSPPAVVFQGGPVETEALIGLARAAGSTDGEGFAPIRAGLGTVDLEAEPDEVEVELRDVRVFRGYAGWGPGQLDDELDSGAWIVVDAEPGDPFSPDPDDLWRAVLRRQGGRLAWLANCPDDVSTN